MINKSPSIYTTSKVCVPQCVPQFTTHQLVLCINTHAILGVQTTAEGHACHATIQRPGQATPIHAVAAITHNDIALPSPTAPLPGASATMAGLAAGHAAGHACAPLHAVHPSANPLATAVLAPQWLYRLGDILRFSPAMLQHAGVSQLLLLQAVVAAYEHEAQHGMPLYVHPDTLFLTSTLWLQHLQPPWQRVGLLCVTEVHVCRVHTLNMRTPDLCMQDATTTVVRRSSTHPRPHPCTNSPLHGSNVNLTITPICYISMQWLVEGGGILHFIPSCHGR